MPSSLQRKIGIGLFAVGLSTAAALGGPEVIQPELADEAARALVKGTPIKVLIMYDGAATPADVAAVQQLGGLVEYRFDLIPVIAATVDPAALNALSNLAGVTWIERDGTMHAFDAELDNTWGVKRIGGGYAHDQGEFGDAVRVAVLDTGIDYNHPELATAYRGGFDFVNNDNDPMDDHDHGSHVSGTIAAALDGAGVVGVAPNVELYGLKVLDAGGNGDFSDIIAAVQWCVDNEIDVTNQSLGTPFNPGNAVKQAYDAAWNAGVLHVAASGNFYGIFGVAYPARYDSVIAVSATEKDNRVAAFSDTGPAIELAAPGVDVNSVKRGGGYILFSGTSMASPHVAGSAALVWATGISDENNNNRINDEVRDRLAMTAIDLGSPGRDTDYGFGIVNAQAALRAPMTLTVSPLVRGLAAQFDAGGATPGETVYFGYSLGGRNLMHVPQLGTILSIRAPQLAGSRVADGSGVAVLDLVVPNNAPVGDIWLQAVEFANPSNLVTTEIH